MMPIFIHPEAKIKIVWGISTPQVEGPKHESKTKLSIYPNPYLFVNG